MNNYFYDFKMVLSTYFPKFTIEQTFRHQSPEKEDMKLPVSFLEWEGRG